MDQFSGRYLGSADFVCRAMGEADQVCMFSLLWLENLSDTRTLCWMDIVQKSEVWNFRLISPNFTFIFNVPAYFYPSHIGS
jgi:hypothetical protein